MTLRIVGAGLGRTGTTSLQEGLATLLGGPCYHFGDLFVRPDDVATWRRLAVRGEAPDWTVMFDGFAATLDWPAAAYWEQIAAAHPDAFVLLSTRASTKEWYESFSKTIAPVMLEDRKHPHEAYEMARRMLALTFTDRVASASAVKRAYEAHNERVRSTVPSHRLIEWQPGDGWAPVCEALGLAEPAEMFPHMNTRNEYRSGVKLDGRPVSLRRRLKGRARSITQSRKRLA